MPLLPLSLKLMGLIQFLRLLRKNFGSILETRPGDAIIPNLKVWGAGGGSDLNSEVNAM